MYYMYRSTYSEEPNIACSPLRREQKAPTICMGLYVLNPSQKNCPHSRSPSLSGLDDAGIIEAASVAPQSGYQRLDAP